MPLRRTHSCPADIGMMRQGSENGPRARTASATDLRASVRRQTDQLIDQNLREASSVRAPGVGGQPLMSAAGVRLSTYAWRFSPPEVDSVAPELRGDRFGLTASLPAFAGHSPAASFYNDTVLFGDSLQGSHGLGGSGFVSFRHGEVSPGLGAGLYCLGGLTVGFSFSMKLVGRGATRVLAVEPQRVLVEQTARRAWGPQGGFGVGLSLVGPLPWVGLVGRAARQQGDSKTLTRWTTPECLLAIESDGQLRQAQVAWRASAPILPWPQPMPGSAAGLPMLAVGERFSRGIDANRRDGLSVALFGVVNGSHRSQDNRITMTAERSDESIWRIAMITEQAGAVTHAAELPIFANASYTRLRSRALEQVFEFDMRQESARAAAGALWLGELPEGAWSASLTPPDAAWLVHLAGHEDLPPGVTRTRVAWMQRPHEIYAGVDAGLPWYTPRWLRAGREQLWRTSSDNCLGWFAGVVHQSHRWQTSVRTQRYHSDERTRTMAANHRHTITAEGAQPGSTSVTMQWRYGRFGTRARAHAVDWLNRHLLTDAPLPPFPTDCPPGAYNLEITREAPTRLPQVTWGNAELCLADELEAPKAFVDLCAHLRLRGDQAMPWLQNLDAGSEVGLEVVPSRPDLAGNINAARTARELHRARQPIAGFHEEAQRLHQTTALRSAIGADLRALEMDPIARRFGGAAWRRAMLAAECAMSATTAPPGTTGRLDASLEKAWTTYGWDAF